MNLVSRIERAQGPDDIRAAQAIADEEIAFR
jgi:hypothetical protein